VTVDDPRRVGVLGVGRLALLDPPGEGATIVKMLATTHPVTQYHVSEDLNLQQCHCKNLRSLTVGSIYSTVLLNFFLFSDVLIF
jgi:hypothetical protein